MSRSIFKHKNISSANNNNSNNTNKRLPFCKVCADAGKTDTAHFPRQTPDPNSPVVCPTLLALECRFCFQNGHTVKYCMVLKERDAMLLQRDRDRNRNSNSNNGKLLAPALTPAPSSAPSSKQPPTGRFHALLDDDDDAILALVAQPGTSKLPTIITTVAEQFPALGFKSVTNSNTNSSNQGGRAWAQMAANAAILPIPIPKPVTKPVAAPETHIGYYYSSDDEEDLDLDTPIYTSSGWDDDTW